MGSGQVFKIVLDGAPLELPFFSRVLVQAQTRKDEHQQDFMCGPPLQDQPTHQALSFLNLFSSLRTD